MEKKIFLVVEDTFHFWNITETTVEEKVKFTFSSFFEILKKLEQILPELDSTSIDFLLLDHHFFPFIASIPPIEKKLRQEFVESGIIRIIGIPESCTWNIIPAMADPPFPDFLYFYHQEKINDLLTIFSRAGITVAKILPLGIVPYYYFQNNHDILEKFNLFLDQRYKLFILINKNPSFYSFFQYSEKEDAYYFPLKKSARELQRFYHTSLKAARINLPLSDPSVFLKVIRKMETLECFYEKNSSSSNPVRSTMASLILLIVAALLILANIGMMEWNLDILQKSAKHQNGTLLKSIANVQNITDMKNRYIQFRLLYAIHQENQDALDAMIKISEIVPEGVRLFRFDYENQKKDPLQPGFRKLTLMGQSPHFASNWEELFSRFENNIRHQLPGKQIKIHAKHYSEKELKGFFYYEIILEKPDETIRVVQ